MQPEPRRGGSASFNRIHDNDAHFDDHQYQIGVEELVQQIKETADKLVRDHASRGDIKLLSTALKELRYARGDSPLNLVPPLSAVVPGSAAGPAVSPPDAA